LLFREAEIGSQLGNDARIFLLSAVRQFFYERKHTGLVIRNGHSPYLVRSAFLGDEFRGSSGAHSKNGRAKAVVGEELDFAKIGIVLVILAAVALKAERLKIIEASRASLAAWDNMVDVERPIFCGRSAKEADYPKPEYYAGLPRTDNGFKLEPAIESVKQFLP